MILKVPLLLKVWEYVVPFFATVFDLKPRPLTLWGAPSVHTHLTAVPFAIFTVELVGTCHLTVLAAPNAETAPITASRAATARMTMSFRMAATLATEQRLELR